METAVKERIVGAAVLVAVVVLVVPALLTGPHERPLAAAPGEGELRRVEIDLTAPGRSEKNDAPDDAAAELPAGIASPVDIAPGTGKAPPSAAASSTATAAAEMDKAASGWAVQVAALSGREAASRMVADLRHRGYAAFMVEHAADGRLLYRIRVGPEARREGADALAERLKRAGFEPTVVTSP